MVTEVMRRRQAVTLIEILVCSIGAFGVLAGLAGLYTLSLTLYKTAVRQDHRLASAGLVEDQLFQITTTCPSDRWQILQGGGVGQDGMPQWRAITYDRLSNHSNRLRQTGNPIQNPFSGFPTAAADRQYYPQDQTSTMDQESGILYWWRDLNTWHPQQGRYLESKVYHLRVLVQQRDQPAGNPNQLRNAPFSQGADSFSDLSSGAIGNLVNNIAYRRISQVLAEDVLEFHLDQYPPAPAQPQGVYWRFDAYRGGS